MEKRMETAIEGSGLRRNLGDGRENENYCLGFRVLGEALQAACKKEWELL